MPSNPLLRCVRLSEFAPSLQATRVPLIIDDTVASVVNVDALRVADVVTSSLTKVFSGIGDVMAGSLVISPRSAYENELLAALNAEIESNDLLWSEDAIVLEENSRDFEERVVRTSVHAAALVDWLRLQPAVEAVYYPGNDGFEEIARAHAGRGCLFSFVLRDPEAASRVFDRLRVCKGPSLGTNFTLACPYTLLAHFTELEWAAACGVRADLIRVSVGLEEMCDLMARFSDALCAAE